MWHFENYCYICFSHNSVQQTNIHWSTDHLSCNKPDVGKSKHKCDESMLIFFPKFKILQTGPKCKSRIAVAQDNCTDPNQNQKFKYLSKRFEVLAT